MFIGREREIEVLEGLYNSNRFELAFIYGRRRVGKTTLINHFIKGKKAIYFTGVESNEKQNLANFSKSIIEFVNGIEAEYSFLSFQAAIEYVFKLAEKERIILIIDEYPYVAHTSKSFESTIQLLIDKYKDSSRLMMILCGSSMSYTEDQMLSYSRIKLLPFDFEETCRYFENLSDEDKAIIYGIAGGTPQYLSQMRDSFSVEENIKNTYLNPTSFLYEEPTNLLKHEVREPAIYSAIMTAIANGSMRMSEISKKVGEDTNVCSIYLKNLINLGIVRKETPYGERTSRRAIYSIEDNMFGFWYRFVLLNNSIIARGASDLAYSRIELSGYMEKVFEDICRQYIWKQLFIGNCPVEFNSLGKWWDNNQKIDIMGEQDRRTAFFAECRWTDENVGETVLEELIKKSGIFPHKTKYYYLFSKSGFTRACIDLAERIGNVQLIGLSQITGTVSATDEKEDRKAPEKVPVWLI